MMKFGRKIFFTWGLSSLHGALSGLSRDIPENFYRELIINSRLLVINIFCTFDVKMRSLPLYGWSFRAQMTTHIMVFDHVAKIPYMGGHFGVRNDHPHRDITIDEDISMKFLARRARILIEISGATLLGWRPPVKRHRNIYLGFNRRPHT